MNEIKSSVSACAITSGFPCSAKHTFANSQDRQLPIHILNTRIHCHWVFSCWSNRGNNISTASLSHPFHYKTIVIPIKFSMHLHQLILDPAVLTNIALNNNTTEWVLSNNVSLTYYHGDHRKDIFIKWHTGGNHHFRQSWVSSTSLPICIGSTVLLEENI